jgi:hypothetical protein
MRIIVDYPVRASGRPKGHHGDKKIIGYVSNEFDIAVNNDPMFKSIELVRPNLTIECLQNGDGHTYRKSNNIKGTIGEGHHFRAQYGNAANPFTVAAMKTVRNQFDRMSEADVTRDYFPKKLHKHFRYSHDYLLDIANEPIENLEFKNAEIALEEVQNVIARHVVCNGELFERIPEPCFVVSLSEARKVSISQWVHGNDEFENNLRNNNTAVAFFNVSDLDRVKDYARDLAMDVKGVFDENVQVSYNVETYQPTSSYGDDLTLYRIARHIELCVSDHMSRGKIIDKLVEWNDETLGLIRDLSRVVKNRDWMNETSKLERLVGLCIDHDRDNRTQMFTRPPMHVEVFDIKLAYSQWQMREFNAPSLRM